MTSISTTLREKQAPIKQGYRDQPDSALATLVSEGSLGQGITCALKGENANTIKEAHKKVAGLHQMAGGPGEGSGELCSGNMLLEALTACAGVTLSSVATAMNIEIESGDVRAEGDLDFKGTMGVDRDAPVGFVAIRLFFDLVFAEGQNIDQAKLEKLGKATERYCVVLQTIVKKPELTVRVKGDDKKWEAKN